ncbi:MAG: hypothetical protein ACKVHL_03945 [Rhodospirillales bacterium]|jgi:hypothetical protein
MKWIIIAALRVSIYLGAIATIATGAMVGNVGGLSIENFSVTGYAGAVVGAVAGVLLAGLIFGTLTVLLDIRDSLAVMRDRPTSSPGEVAFQEPAAPQTPSDEKRKEPFLGST